MSPCASLANEETALSAVSLWTHLCLVSDLLLIIKSLCVSENTRLYYQKSRINRL